MKRLIYILSFILFQIVIGPVSLQAQSDFLEYADSTQILLVFDDEQDTAAINELKQELQAVELATTPFTRIHLWQIPLDTIAAYGGVSGILNHAIGKPRIKGGSMNYSAPLMLNIDDNDDDPGVPQAPLCYNDSLFDCVAGTTAVNMAFMDTGFDGEPTGTRTVWLPNHPIFNNRPFQNAGESGKSLNIDNDKNGFTDDVRGWDFHNNDNMPLDDNGHGSHTAGLAALKQSANNDMKRNKIMMLKTHNQEGVGSIWQVVQAIDYALRFDIKIVNMSFAYLSPVNANGKPTIVEYLMDFGKTYKGTLFIAAAGNDSINIDLPIILNNGMAVKYCPAALPNPNLIVVAAGTCENELASFSNYGPVHVDIAAPGIEIYSALLDGTYGYLTGTSMAAPHVTAAAALAASKDSVFNWKKIKYDLLNRSTPSVDLVNYVSSGRMLTFCNNYLPSANPLMVTAKANKVLCVGGNATLTASATGGQSPYSFVWSNGSTGKNRNITVAGTYTVTVTDGAGSTASETLNVFGASAPLAQTILQPVSCSDDCTILEISNAVAGANYLWNTGLKTTSIYVCPDITNTYSVTTTTPNGCSSVTQITLASLHVEVAPLSDTVICPCTPTTLTATAQGGIGPLNYLWSPGDATTADVTVSLNSGSVAYSVSVSDSRGCTASASALISTSCFAPVALSATYNSQNLKTTFSWAKGPCKINRTQLRWRCNSSSSWNTVTINDTSVNSYSLTLPALCSPLWQIRNRCCNNVNSPWKSPAIARLENDNSNILELPISMNLYPNPAGGFIHLNWEGATSEERIYIYNSQGKLMMVHGINDGIKTTTIDIKNLSTGLYFLRFDGVSKSFSKQ
ncbi:MAG: S8 family serine peptidase [Bacteroidetes bacterium]|nr:S8 family serine peptidase [Bacteroidota bacterium]